MDARSILDVEPADLRGFAQCHFFAGIGGWPYALRLAGVAADLSVWTGSPPCQPFSQAGQRKGQDDDRHLAPTFLRLVAACRPELVFGEQVASAAVLGPVGGAARAATEGAAGWAWFDALAADLEAASYAVAAADLPAAAEHLASCARLARDIPDFGRFETHDAYVGRLKEEHGRKFGFWSRLDG
ncbi:DUF6880 family protein [Nioella halotolerans]|uniref:DUF6880 family protein n=1 Tax=Nioella halotolerans TaxID=2303578 RepID=UPI0026AD5CD4